MIKEAVASKAAKLLMTCVCPVAGTTALSLGVPQVRDAVHKATKPRQYAKANIRERLKPIAPQMAAATECPDIEPFVAENMTPPAQEQPPQLAQAETPPPETAVPLEPGTSIFVPPGGGETPPNSGVPEPSTWVQLILGFGLIGGVARVSYRKNGTQPDEAEA